MGEIGLGEWPLPLYQALRVLPHLTGTGGYSVKIVSQGGRGGAADERSRGSRVLFDFVVHVRGFV